MVPGTGAQVLFVPVSRLKAGLDVRGATTVFGGENVEFWLPYCG